MREPSGEKDGAVSIEGASVSREMDPEARSVMKMSVLPPFDSE
jgi:hypothetical protein